MHEDLPQVAEHAFGNHCKTQVVVNNPAFAILLGLRRFGWLTYAQCRMRIFSWSAEYANDKDCHPNIVPETVKELEELGLISVKYSEEDPTKITEVHDSNFRFTRRTNLTKNNNDEDFKPKPKKVDEDVRSIIYDNEYGGEDNPDSTGPVEEPA